MKVTTILCSIVTLGLLTGGLASAFAAEKAEKGEKVEKSEKAEKKDKESKLEAQAKITKAEAEKTALTKVPGGTIKEGGIEEEKGKLIWSFDITMPDTKDITEVRVDAKTGEIVAVDKETPADQEKEAKEGKEKKHEKGEKKSKRGDKDDDDDDKDEQK